MKFIMQIVMLTWGVCLMLVPAFREADGLILGTVWIVGSLLLGWMPKEASK